ncbi:MAG: AgmX/PglI C-terminal domain-containing protein [Myxococcales bacterium FL481]|nr:MAG: AgmX/PglI C-terminal domain-containing protein [Myxococcales bacterium FL481]
MVRPRVGGRVDSGRSRLRSRARDCPKVTELEAAQSSVIGSAEVAIGIPPGFGYGAGVGRGDRTQRMNRSRQTARYGLRLVVAALAIVSCGESEPRSGDERPPVAATPPDAAASGKPAPAGATRGVGVAAQTELGAAAAESAGASSKGLDAIAPAKLAAAGAETRSMGDAKGLGARAAATAAPVASAAEPHDAGTPDDRTKASTPAPGGNPAAATASPAKPAGVGPAAPAAVPGDSQSDPGESDAASAEAPPPPEVDVDPPRLAVAGSFDRGILRRIVRAHRRQIAACLNPPDAKALKKAARVSFDVVVDGSGRVETAERASGQLPSDTGSSDCMAGSIQTWKFPRPRSRETVPVTLRFVIRPGR